MDYSITGWIIIMKNKDVIIISYHTESKCLVDKKFKCRNKTTGKLEENHVIIFTILKFLIRIRFIMKIILIWSQKQKP